MNKTNKRLLILGPNFVGKTTLFQNFVNKRSIQKHYYPGTRVPIYTGTTTIAKEKYTVIDVPGIHNLVPTSENEIVTLNLLLNYNPDCIIFVTKEDLIEHNLLIMIQLAELQIPFVVCFYQKHDYAQSPVSYDQARLCTFFNTHSYFITPVLTKGLTKIKKDIATIMPPRWVGGYPKKIEQLLEEFDTRFRERLGLKQNSRFIGLMLILSNQSVFDLLRKRCDQETWEELTHFEHKNSSVNHSLTIANRWKELTDTLMHEIGIEETPRNSKPLVLLDKYSLSYVWDIAIMIFVLLSWFWIMNVLGNHFLVNLLYNEVFWKYIGPMFQQFFSTFFPNSLLQNLFMGPFGLLNIGISYAFTIILPTLAVFYFIYAFLDDMGYLSRMTISAHHALSLFGLNGYYITHLVSGASCKIAGLLKSRTLGTSKARQLSLLVLLFAIPCISQFAIISNLLAIIPRQYVFIYITLILTQIFIILKIAQALDPSPNTNLAIKIQALTMPHMGKVFIKTWSYIRWYIKEIVPLLLISSIVLFICDTLHVLDFLRTLIMPLITEQLQLPDHFVDTIILGLFRKDFGAVSLYDLANNGLLNSIQVLVSVVFLTLSIPCLGFLGAIYKEHGFKKTLLLFIFSTIYAYAIAWLLNIFLRL